MLIADVLILLYTLRPTPDTPISLVRVVQILQLMYHMALDAFDKATPPTFSPPDIGMSMKDVSYLFICFRIGEFVVV